MGAERVLPTVRLIRMPGGRRRPGPAGGRGHEKDAPLPCPPAFATFAPFAGAARRRPSPGFRMSGRGSSPITTVRSAEVGEILDRAPPASPFVPDQPARALDPAGVVDRDQ